MVGLNLVERWFAELTNRRLRRSAHRSVTELETDVETWIQAWSEDPKPFVWTKTADEILDGLAHDDARCHQPVLAQQQGELPHERGEYRAIGPVQPRAWAGPAQHADLMSQHQQFDVLGRRVAG